MTNEEIYRQCKELGVAEQLVNRYRSRFGGGK